MCCKIKSAPDLKVILKCNVSMQRVHGAWFSHSQTTSCVKKNFKYNLIFKRQPPLFFSSECLFCLFNVGGVGCGIMKGFLSERDTRLANSICVCSHCSNICLNKHLCCSVSVGFLWMLSNWKTNSVFDVTSVCQSWPTVLSATNPALGHFHLSGGPL